MHVWDEKKLLLFINWSINERFECEILRASRTRLFNLLETILMIYIYNSTGV